MEAAARPPDPEPAATAAPGPATEADDEYRAAVAALARRLTTPIDVPALVAQGVLVRRGPRWLFWRRWYEVLAPRRLPEWAFCQIEAMRAGPRDTVWVRFRVRHPTAERLAAELEGVPVAPTGDAQRQGGA